MSAAIAPPRALPSSVSSDVPSPPCAGQRARADGVAALVGSPPRILVVEPDARTRSLLEVGLSRAGFEVLVTRTPAEAREHLDASRAPLAMVVCEADLEGGEDGFRFRGELRADPRTAQLPILLLTGRPEVFLLEMASGPGADDHLPKPVFLNDVVALAKLKAGRPAGQAAFTAHTDALPPGQLVRALLAGMRTGQLEMADGSARLTFRQGQVVDAEVEGARGPRALSRMLLLARGPYTVAFGPATATGTLCVDLRELCRVVLPDLLRARRMLERAIPLEAVLRIDTQRLREVLPDLPDSVNGLLRLYDGNRTLRQAILKCELPESTALLVTTRLYGLGALEPLALPPPEEGLVRPARTWEPRGVKSFTGLVGPEGLDERVDVALAPPKIGIVDVVHFAPRPREPRSLQQAVIIAADTLAPVPAPRRRRSRVLVASVAAGMVASFAVSVLAPVLVRPAAPAMPSEAVAHVSALPEWLAPRAAGTARDWTALGLDRYDSGDLEGARDAIANALALDPRQGQALLLLATIHYRQGRKIEARAALRRYLAAAPKGELAAEARSLLAH